MKTSLRATLLAATALFALPAYAQEAKEEQPAAAAPVAAEKPAASPSKDYTMIKLGSDEIKNSDVQAAWKGLFPDGGAPDFNGFDENIKLNVLRGLVSERLIYQEALKGGYDKNAEVKKRLEQMQKQVVMQSFMEDKAKSLVTDAQLKAAYQQKVAEAKGQEEVKARHILVAKEEDAKALEGKLKKGGDFDKLAKDQSTDRGSGAKGGELGWFTKDKMVPEFADAAFKLKKGEISAPVKSPFGWHVIQVEDRRPLQVASFDDMKENLRGELTNKSVQTYVEGLLTKADIKYYGTDGKEKDFPRTLAPLAPAAKGDEKPAADAPAAPAADAQ